MKKIFKKSLALVLSAALCLTALVGCLTVSAEETAAATPTYKIVSTEGTAGATVKVTAELTNLNNVCAHLIDIVYPSDLKLGTVTDSLGNTYSSYEAWLAAEKDSEKPYYNIIDGEGVKHIRFVEFVNWPTGDDRITTSNMNFFIEFVIPEGAAAGTEYTITPTVQAGAYEESSALLDVTLTEGKVTVKENATHKHTEATSTLVNVTDTEFVYDCTCTECDETYQKTVEIGADATGTIRFGKTLQPANDISIEFHLVRADVEAYSNFVLVAEKAVYAANATEPTYVPKYITSYDENSLSSLKSYRFVFTDIAGYEMNNNISATVYGLKDGQMHKIKSTDYSVVTFLNNMMKNANSTKQQKDVYVDMAKYGAKSQLLAKVNVANLADSFLTEEQLANYGTNTYPTSANDFKAIDLDKTVNSSFEYGTINLGRTLTLENKINIIYWLDLSKFTGDVNQLYCKFDYYEVNGSSNTYTYKYDGYLNNGYKSFKFDKAPVSTIDYPVRSTVYYGDPANGGVEMISISYSIETFFKNRFNAATAEQLAVYKTIYAYGRSLATLAGVSEYVK